MTKKATTKDELFLLKLYELGGAEQEVDRYHIGKAIGQNTKGVDTIVKHLAQANFVKKGRDEALILTPHGMRLVLELIKER